ncbi:MAG: TonB-dependent receptor, partial [Candidatus Marinimicrobia bacterium]|nr:TonB-dependent receptor [Candidatus Neomarinimicrobiota bacterium]
MKFRLLFRLLPALLAPIMLWAGTSGKITGKITDGETGMPLAGVNVVVTGTTYGTAADASGRYVIMNIPAGTYTLAASMIGYKTVTMTNVQVNVDLTTTQDYALVVAAIEGESVIVEATRPIIQQDMTASRTIQSGEEVLRMPVDNYEGALVTIAGAVVEGGQVHFRGGRAQEIVYLLDNTAMVDPLSGNNDTEVSTFAIQETHTMTGGFSAEYGNAQSGVVNVITKDGGDTFSGKVRLTTSGYGLSNRLADIPVDEVAENRNRMEIGLSGPVLKGILPGRLTYLLTGDFLDTQGRFVNQEKTTSNILAKLTYRPDPRITLRLKALIGNEYYDKFNGAGGGFSQGFANLWKKTVYEDQLFDGKEGFESWVGNQQVDTEDVGLDNGSGTLIGARNGRIDYIDINGNGVWDENEPTEDINGNGKVDTEDLDHNGILDAHNMLDHLAPYDLSSDQYEIFLTHQVSVRTFYELHFTRYHTRNYRNTNEAINEDIDGDGRMDDVDEWIQTAGGAFQWVDLDGDGYFDRGNEDLNGNGLLDPYGTDLCTDENANEYVDASEIGTAPRESYRLMGERDPLSSWMPWGDIGYQGVKDDDGFYTYATGTTWDRTAWYRDESYDYGLKFDIDSQIMENHLIRAGIDAHVKDIFRYDAVDRYGYGEKFNVKPYQFAGYIQDKMEYGGMILNIGLRYDYFDARWDNYPNNGRDPTWDLGSEVYFGGNEDLNSNGRLDPGEDLNGNGVLDQDWIAEKYQIGGLWEDTNNNGRLDPGEDLPTEDFPKGNGELDFPVYLIYPGDIKDPRTVPSQDFFSPRFGISYPITENDKMYFSYGRYFSAPPGNNLYRNLDFDLGGGFPIIGNPNLAPEKTTSYEAGI